METAKATQSKLKQVWKPVAIVALVSLLIVGEVVFQQAKRKGWTAYTVEDGLPSNDVESIAVAPDGEVWVGTWSRGVSHFDGETWTSYPYTIGDPWTTYAQSIALAPDGALWVATVASFGNKGSGVSRFDGKTWTTYTENDGLASNDLRAVAVAPDGVVWVGTHESGVSRFDGETWTTYTYGGGVEDNRVTSIAIALNGVVWFGTGGAGLYRFDGRTWTTYTEDDGLVDNVVSSIAVAPDGVLWVGTQNRGVSRFDGETWITYTESGVGLASNHITSIAVVPDGVVWFGTGNGVSRFDGEIWTAYTPANSGLAKYSAVNALAVDGQGRVWVGTDSYGEALSVLDERVSLPVQALQTWIVLRMLGITALVLLTVVWIVRSKSITAKDVESFLAIGAITYVIAVPLLWLLLVAVGFYVDSGALPMLGALVLAIPVAIVVAFLVVRWRKKPH